MKEDIFGQRVTLTQTPVVAHWNATQMAFLAHSADTPRHLADTLAAAPDFALGHAVKGMFLVLLGRREVVADAAAALGAAHAALECGTATPRERLYVDLLAVWLRGDLNGALARFGEILEHHAGDALAVKLDHALRFVMGDAVGMRRTIEAVLHAYGDDHPALGYLHGCHAFALEETGAYPAAQRSGRRGLDLASDDAWGLHAIAHVHDMTADARGGIAWLDGRESAWAHCNNFRFHVWWHKALMHLDLGDIDAALALYDTEIRREKTDDYRDISNATSLLSRLELEGVDVGHRWEELAEFSAGRTEDGCLIFADLHYLMALIGGDRKGAIRSLMGRLHNDAREGNTDIQKAMAKPGLSAAAGLEAFGDGEYAGAFVNLRQARASLQRAGGSHAQRDVFERLTIDAGIRAGFLDQAADILSQRTACRGGFVDGYAAARLSLIDEGRKAAAVG